LTQEGIEFTLQQRASNMKQGKETGTREDEGKGAHTKEKAETYQWAFFAGKCRICGRVLALRAQETCRLTN
jgi:hypothetical protein